MTRRLLLGLRFAVLAGVLVGAVGLVGWCARDTPLGATWLTTTLGPTAYVILAHPRSVTARLRNGVVGHITGIVVGLAALAVFGLWDAPSIAETHVESVAQVLAQACALGVTLLVLTLADAHHAPSGATALLVSAASPRPGSRWSGWSWASSSCWPRPRCSHGCPASATTPPRSTRARPRWDDRRRPGKDHPVTVLAVALALLAAVGNAGGDLLQRAAARDESSDPRRSFSPLGDLVRQRRWLAGVLVSVLGLAVHVGALSGGELATVQPIIVCELLLAVLGSALFFGRRLARRDWAAVVALAAGLALFIVFLSPQAGNRLGVPGEVWAIGTAAVVAAMATLLVASLRAENDLPRRATGGRSPARAR